MISQRASRHVLARGSSIILEITSFHLLKAIGGFKEIDMTQKPEMDLKSPGAAQDQADIAKDLIDVLIRGLGTASDELASDTESGGVCIGYYADSTHSCALWYSHPH